MSRLIASAASVAVAAIVVLWACVRPGDAVKEGIAISACFILVSTGVGNLFKRPISGAACGAFLWISALLTRYWLLHGVTSDLAFYAACLGCTGAGALLATTGSGQRRFQFSLRALLLAMLVVSAFFGGTFVSRKHERQLERSLMAEKEGHAKTAQGLRDAITQLIQAEKRIKELEAAAAPGAP